jgi:succinoglycan biosynthesis transport protein ExoP
MVAVARSALSAVRAQIAHETQRLTASAASDMAIAQANVRRLEAEQNNADKQLAATSKDELTSAQLDRDIEADRHLYDDLLLRSKQVSIQGQLQEPDILVVSPPQLPLSPAFPRRFMLLAVAAMASAVVGTLAAFALNSLGAGKVVAMDLVAAACGLPGLAIIPKLTKAERRRAMPQPGSHLAASLQTLKNSIDFCSGGSPPRITVFASALPGEGKTLLATLYARSRVTAGGGKRVLLVYADMRRFGTNKTPAGGLQRVLNGQPLAECVVPDIVSGLDILSSAAGDEVDPGMVFSAGGVNDLLAAAAQYDTVIIDTPPIGVVDDALHLIAAADANVLVARWNRTSMAAVRHALRRMTMTGAQVVGVVLTAVDMKKYRSGADSPSSFAKRRAYYIAAS